eukprot:Selendium_serpulae@DN4215_c1_g1_i1.p1
MPLRLLACLSLLLVGAVGAKSAASESELCLRLFDPPVLPPLAASSSHSKRRPSPSSAKGSDGRHRAVPAQRRGPLNRTGQQLACASHESRTCCSRERTLLLRAEVAQFQTAMVMGFITPQCAVLGQERRL